MICGYVQWRSGALCRCWAGLHGGSAVPDGDANQDRSAVWSACTADTPFKPWPSRVAPPRLHLISRAPQLSHRCSTRHRLAQCAAAMAAMGFDLDAAAAAAAAAGGRNEMAANLLLGGGGAAPDEGPVDVSE